MCYLVGRENLFNVFEGIHHVFQGVRVYTVLVHLDANSEADRLSKEGICTRSY